MVTGSPHCVDGCRREPATQACRRKQQDRWLRRRLLQRQLHDGAALRISALTLRLGLLQHRALPDGQEVAEHVNELQDELHAVLEELRAVAAEIYPPLLDEAGLGPALRERADQLRTPVTVVDCGDRFGPAAEGAAYFAVTQCLPASPEPVTRPHEVPSIKVVIQRENDELMLSISGIEACHVEHMDDHAWPLGGTVDVMDAVLPGTSTITMRIPCE